MFDLDEAITAWRQRMLDAGIKTPVPLDELESHLRDDVEAQMNSGMDGRQAFESAIPRVGLAVELKNEFQKAKLNQPMKLETHKLLRAILVAIALVAVGMGLILPATAKWREVGALDGYLTHLLIGVAVCLGGVAWGVRGTLEYRKVQ